MTPYTSPTLFPYLFRKILCLVVFFFYSFVYVTVVNLTCLLYRAAPQHCTFRRTPPPLPPSSQIKVLVYISNVISFLHDCALGLCGKSHKWRQSHAHQNMHLQRQRLKSGKQRRDWVTRISTHRKHYTSAKLYKWERSKNQGKSAE